MKNFEKPGRWKRYILPTLLLAALCIGAVELWVCSFQAPELYAAITEPVFSAVQRTGEAGGLIWSALRRRTDEAVAEGASRVQAGLRRLDEYLSRPLEAAPDASDGGPAEGAEDGELQLVDGSVAAPPPRSQAAYSVTALAARNGTEYLTGGSRELIYYNQTGAQWAQEPYGSDTIGPYGCGPVAMAMVVSSLTDTAVDPIQMAQHCVDQGYWAKKHGSYWSIVPGTAEDFGLTCTPLPPEEADVDMITHCLSTGQLLVAMVGPGHFTNGGHFIILRGITLDGSILVADPASPDRSLTTWDLELILSELSANRSSGGPLWAISPGSDS